MDVIIQARLSSKRLPSKVLKKVKFTHPYFDQSALTYQTRLKNLQNKRNILFCGSYFGYGFHEDGLKSSIELVNKFKT